MSFAAKTDFIGLTDSGNPLNTVCELKSNSDGHSQQVLQIPGDDGSIIGDEIYGEIKNPSCEYVILSYTTIQADLGKCYNAPYALQHIHISTSAGGEPTITADGVQIEASSQSTYCYYTTSQVGISPARHALDFGAFTYTQSSTLTLQTSEYDAQVNIDPTTINGLPKASDSTAGIETVAVTFWTNSNTVEPSVTANTSDGWKNTTGWSCTGADSSRFKKPS